MKTKTPHSSGTFPVCTIAVFALIAATSLGAQVSFETSTSAGVLLGTSREIVLDGAYKVSELDWPMQPLVLAGSRLLATMPAGVRASLEVEYGVPGKTGLITDKDFLNGDGVVTHFSEHDSFAEGALLLDARIGKDISLGAGFTLAPFVGFSLMRFAWTARDGYLQYPPEGSAPFTPWNPRTTPRDLVYGTGIVYQQTWYIPEAGMRAGIGFGGSLEVALALDVSPYLWMNDLDNHEMRQLDFVGTMKGGLLADPSLEVAFRLGPRARLSLGVDYRIIWGLRGDTLEIGAGVDGVPGPSGLLPGQSIRFTGASGASYDALGAVLSLDLSL